EKVMCLAAERAAPRAINAAKNGDALDLTALGPDWHQTSDLSGLSGEYRKVWYCPRESGEAALTQLMVRDQPFPEQQKDLLAHAITRLDYERVSSSGIFYLLAAYWKACNRGVFPQPRP
ncbi:MAG TPA: hypothetical protein VHR86_04120, partial [Armatimonadota bacterium]|nr:hypothetical protein [Armatimonadota bacterium]